ncbi:MAG: hypothetical protein WEC84_04215 [Candidatus Andersenbacteria bacterium]
MGGRLIERQKTFDQMYERLLPREVLVALVTCRLTGSESLPVVNIQEDLERLERGEHAGTHQVVTLFAVPTPVAQQLVQQP